MDDKILIFQVKGRPYRSRPLSPESLAMLQTVQSMGASGMQLYRALLKTLENAALDPAEWDGLIQRVINGDVDTMDIVDLAKRLATKTVDHYEATAPAAPVDAG